MELLPKNKESTNGTYYQSGKRRKSLYLPLEIIEAKKIPKMGDLSMMLTRDGFGFMIKYTFRDDPGSELEPEGSDCASSLKIELTIPNTWYNIWSE